jgi:hypothetical protein
MLTKTDLVLSYLRDAVAATKYGNVEKADEWLDLARNIACSMYGNERKNWRARVERVASNLLDVTSNAGGKGEKILARLDKTLAR